MNIFELFILAIGLSMDAFAAYVYRRRMVRGISGINAPCGIFWRTILCR